MSVVSFISTPKRYEPTEARPRVLFIDGHPYPVGLEWRDAATDDMARSIAKAEKRLYVYHSKGKQVALLSSPDHHAGKQLYATALALLLVRPDLNWVGFYQITGTPHFPQGFYWLIVVKGRRVVRDEVLALEDAISEAEALRRDGTDYSQFIAPAAVADGHEEKLHNLLDPQNDPKFKRSGVSFDVSGLSEALPPISGTWAAVAVVVSIGVTWSLTQWLHRPVVQIIKGDPIVTEKLVLVTNPVRAVPDPAFFLDACERTTGMMLALGHSVGANLACFAPRDRQPVWTASVTFPAPWPIPSASSQVTLPPYRLISSADSGIPPEQTVAALTKMLPAALVTVSAKATATPLTSPNADRASPTAALQGVVAPGPVSGAASKPATASQGEASASRTITDLILTSKVSPSAWSAALARTPLAVERVTRDATGVWTIHAKVL